MSQLLQISIDIFLSRPIDSKVKLETSVSDSRPGCEMIEGFSGVRAENRLQEILNIDVCRGSKEETVPALTIVSATQCENVVFMRQQTFGAEMNVSTIINFERDLIRIIRDRQKMREQLISGLNRLQLRIEDAHHIKVKRPV